MVPLLFLRLRAALGVIKDQNIVLVPCACISTTYGFIQIRITIISVDRYINVFFRKSCPKKYACSRYIFTGSRMGEGFWSIFQRIVLYMKKCRAML
jgi:hypothetical protein